MNRATSVTLLLFSMAPFLGAQSTDRLTVEEALAAARTANRVLHMSATRVSAARSRAGETSAALLPSLKLEASYRRLSDVDPFQVSVPFFPTPITISPVVLNNFAVRASLQQPLFTGFKLQGAADAAAKMLEASEADRLNDAAEVTLSVTTVYWGLYQAQEGERLIRENVQRLESYEADAKRLVQAGLATSNDLLRVQVQLASARLSLIDAINDVQVGRMNLNALLVRPLDHPFVLASAPQELADQPQDTTAGGLNRALADRPDLLAQQARVGAARAGVTVARGNWWPQVFLQGNYYYSRPNPRYMPTRDEFLGTWDIGLVLQFDLWNWGMTGAQVEQATAQLRLNEILLEQVQDNTRLDVQRQKLAVARAVARLDVSRLAVQQAEENLRTLQEKYRNGLATTADLLDAEVSLLQAKTQHTGALVERTIAHTRLQKALGVLP